MSINIYAFFGFFALISEFEFKPTLCGIFNNCAFDFESRKDHCVNVLAQ